MNTIDYDKQQKGKSNINPPKFPPNRILKYSGFSLFSFKPTKVKHAFIISIYLFSLVISFLVMFATQNSSGMCAKWFVGNVFLFGFTMIIKGFIYIIKNWNKPI